MDEYLPSLQNATWRMLDELLKESMKARPSNEESYAKYLKYLAFEEWRAKEEQRKKEKQLAEESEATERRWAKEREAKAKKEREDAEAKTREEQQKKEQEEKLQELKDDIDAILGTPGNTTSFGDLIDGIQRVYPWVTKDMILDLENKIDSQKALSDRWQIPMSYIFKAEHRYDMALTALPNLQKVVLFHSISQTTCKDMHK